MRFLRLQDLPWTRKYGCSTWWNREWIQFSQSHSQCICQQFSLCSNRLACNILLLFLFLFYARFCANTTSPLPDTLYKFLFWFVPFVCCCCCYWRQQIAQLINSKSKSLYFQKKKAARLTWTTAWRLLHKKGQSFGTRRRVKRGKTNRVVRRGIGALSMKDIRNRRTKIKTARKK